MPRIQYLDGPTVDVDIGESVLDASMRHGVEHQHACGGNARCTTCRIEVLEGEDRCPEPCADERELLAINRLEPPMRLACQLRPQGDITVRVLMCGSGHAEAPWLKGDMAREMEVAVLFSDIRNFTGLAARQLPFDVLHLLNRYFDLMCPFVESHQGEVLSFQGDGMLALFPDGGGPPAARAVRCGLEMLEACPPLDEYSLEHFGFKLRLGIGVDFGRTLVCKVGYYRSMQMTAIGDVVNTAARVQGLTKETDADLLVTEIVCELTQGQFRFGRHFAADLRGKDGQYEVCEVLGPK